MNNRVRERERERKRVTEVLPSYHPDFLCCGSWRKFALCPFLKCQLLSCPVLNGHLRRPECPFDDILIQILIRKSNFGQKSLDIS